MYKLFIALRYLKRRIITYIAIAGVSVGVMVLVIVISVMGGFQREFHQKIRGTMADIMITRDGFEMKDYDEIVQTVLNVVNDDGEPLVEAASPYIQNIILIKGMRIDFGFIKGIDPARELSVTKLKEYLLRSGETRAIVKYDRLKREIEGYERMLRLLRNQADERGMSRDELESTDVYHLCEQQLEQLREEFAVARQEYDRIAESEPMNEEEIMLLFGTRRTDLPGVVVGIELFEHYAMEIGCEVMLLTAASLDVEEASQQRFEVLGAFRTGLFEHDFRYVYTQLYDAQQFIGVPGAASGISVKTRKDKGGRDLYSVDEVRARIEGAIRAGPVSGVAVLTWQEQNRTLLQAVRMEKWLLGFIIFFIVIVAGFTIVSILTMMVVEKTNDLGIIKSLGGTTSGVMTIFLIAGAFIGVVGCAIGTFLGLTFVYNINEVADIIHSVTGYHPFPKNVYYLDRIPTQVDTVEILSVVLPTILVAFVFALYPAIRASKLAPVEALRYE